MKKTTKILSIILALIMCFGILPITAFAGSIVHVHGVESPVAERKASWYWSSYGSNLDVRKWKDKDGDDCYWAETDSVPANYSAVKSGKRIYKSQGNYYFKANKIYTFVAYVNPPYQHIFTSDRKGYINDKECHFEKAADGDCWIMWYVFGKPTDPIRDITITDVKYPKTGEKPSFDFTVPSNKHYSKDSISWYETDTIPRIEDGDLKMKPRMVSTDTFKAHKYYTVEIKVKINDDAYRFAERLSGSVNGISAYAESEYFENHGAVYYTFAKTDEIINTVTITGVVEPVVGATASYNWSFPNDSKYYKKLQTDGSNCAWYETDNYETDIGYIRSRKAYTNASSDKLTFKPNKYYTLLLYIQPYSGYAFSDPLNATVNGRRAETWAGGWVWITFNKTPPEKTLSSISVITQPSKNIYTEGQSFDKSGMVVRANYSNGTSATITNYTVTNGTNLAMGRTSVTISYTEDGVTKTTTVLIYVISAKALTSISVTTQPTKKIYTEGQNFDKTGMVVKANYANGTSATITNYTVTNGTNLPAGRTYVAISYTEGGVTKTTTVPITVNASTAILTGIEITSKPSSTNLQYKSTASTNGLKVTAKYSNGTTKDVTSQVKVSNFSANNKRGTHTATVEYEGKTATFNYNVDYVWWQWIIKIVLFGWIWY